MGLRRTPYILPPLISFSPSVQYHLSWNGVEENSLYPSPINLLLPLCPISPKLKWGWGELPISFPQLISFSPSVQYHLSWNGVEENSLYPSPINLLLPLCPISPKLKWGWGELPISFPQLISFSPSVQYHLSWNGVEENSLYPSPINLLLPLCPISPELKISGSGELLIPPPPPPLISPSLQYHLSWNERFRGIPYTLLPPSPPPKLISPSLQDHLSWNERLRGIPYTLLPPPPPINLPLSPRSLELKWAVEGNSLYPPPPPPPPINLPLSPRSLELKWAVEGNSLYPPPPPPPPPQTNLPSLQDHLSWNERLWGIPLYPPPPPPPINLPPLSKITWAEMSGWGEFPIPSSPPPPPPN